MNAVLKPVETPPPAPELAPPPNPAHLAALAAIHFVQIDPPRPAPAGCWTNSKGHFVPVEDVAEYEQLREQTLRPLVADWLETYLAMADLKARIRDEIAALIQVCADQHKVELAGKKGNITLYLYDGSMKVERSYQRRTAFDEQIQAAEALARQCLDDLTASVPKEVRDLLLAAFERNEKGELRRSELIRLRSHKIADERWERAMKIIADAEIELESACYYAVSVRDANGKYHPLPLDFASVRPHKS